jgi:hypothetical protein
MAYTASHGPPLKDATHQWDPPTTSNPPVINDVQREPLVLPQIELLRCTGWRDLPDLVDNRAPRTVGVGEMLYPPRYTGKTLVYECEMQAGPDDTTGAARESLLAMQMSLVAGFGDRDSEGVMTVTPWAAPGGVTWTYSALVTDLKFDPEWKLDANDVITYRWEFSLTLRMSDPHFYTGSPPVGYL